VKRTPPIRPRWGPVSQEPPHANAALVPSAALPPRQEGTKSTSTDHVLRKAEKRPGAPAVDQRAHTICGTKHTTKSAQEGDGMAWYHATRADERRTHACGGRAGLRLGLAHKLSARRATESGSNGRSAVERRLAAAQTPPAGLAKVSGLRPPQKRAPSAARAEVSVGPGVRCCFAKEVRSVRGPPLAQ
jgi:hypothetical protein